MKIIRSLAQAVEASLKARESKEHKAKFTIEVDGEKWRCHTVAIASKDILCYCDKGTATYLVDSMNSIDYFGVLHDWEKCE